MGLLVSLKLVYNCEKKEPIDPTAGFVDRKAILVVRIKTG
jgi:hypothetical protein